MATKECPVCKGTGTVKRRDELGGVYIGGSSIVVCGTCGGKGFLEFADRRTEHQSYADPRKRY